MNIVPCAISLFALQHFVTSLNCEFGRKIAAQRGLFYLTPMHHQFQDAHLPKREKLLNLKGRDATVCFFVVEILSRQWAEMPAGSGWKCKSGGARRLDSSQQTEPTASLRHQQRGKLPPLPRTFRLQASNQAATWAGLGRTPAKHPLPSSAQLSRPLARRRVGSLRPGFLSHPSPPTRLAQLLLAQLAKQLVNGKFDIFKDFHSHRILSIHIIIRDRYYILYYSLFILEVASEVPVHTNQEIKHVYF